MSRKSISLFLFSMGFPGKEPTCQSRRHKRCSFHPWVGMIPWRMKLFSRIYEPINYKSQTGQGKMIILLIKMQVTGQYDFCRNVSVKQEITVARAQLFGQKILGCFQLYSYLPAQVTQFFQLICKRIWQFLIYHVFKNPVKYCT